MDFDTVDGIELVCVKGVGGQVRYDWLEKSPWRPNRELVTVEKLVGQRLCGRGSDPVIPCHHI